MCLACGDWKLALLLTLAPMLPASRNAVKSGADAEENGTL